MNASTKKDRFSLQSLAYWWALGFAQLKRKLGGSLSRYLYLRSGIATAFILSTKTRTNMKFVRVLSLSFMI